MIKQRIAYHTFGLINNIVTVTVIHSYFNYIFYYLNLSSTIIIKYKEIGKICV